MGLLQRIKYWDKVPQNLKTKTQLKELGLKPIGEPKAEIKYLYSKYIKLYDIEETKPIQKRKATFKQLEALEKGRMKLDKCEMCNEVVGRKNLSKQICFPCYQNELEKEYVLKKFYQMEQGEERFKEWKQHDFVILDSQTTGLYDPEIIELSIIDKEGNVLFESLIKPKNPIPPEATSIHGITNQMTANSPCWLDVWEEVKGLITDKLLLIYNADYDIGVIWNTCSLYNIVPPSLKSNCVMRAYADWKGYERWVGLSEAYGGWTEHRALDDCRATLDVIRKVWKEIEEQEQREGETA
ncbi:3'-5' exonuclease [Ammoniphilus sp. 3BR4]|uniref:3'-5' exonuclease n=1 Tax=Ammoniphilus sp. 3BR4 TaxID=3158265 RepID=UPI003466EB2D